MRVPALAAAFCLAASAVVCAQERALKPESQVKLRKSAYALMNYNFATLDAMAEGKRPYDKEEAGKAADWVANLSEVPKKFFGESKQWKYLVLYVDHRGPMKRGTIGMLSRKIFSSFVAMSCCFFTSSVTFH